ncbi:hypothetical protein PILCRDRAFT_502045 [Piloderma croceum F 1598]|uniref:Uncharacterized protein n=1 Tax=Piloderma croceum (strain F 1598) TaxID=765440 RepID=A0A0C3FNW1_PILCF|nr:hypothetical protein PILCRDRAFT_502045 [Piloderma croceum F 1598]
MVFVSCYGMWKYAILTIESLHSTLLLISFDHFSFVLDASRHDLDIGVGAQRAQRQSSGADYLNNITLGTRVRTLRR